MAEDKPVEEMTIQELTAAYEEAKKGFDGVNRAAHETMNSRGPAITVRQKSFERMTRNMLIQQKKARLMEIARLLKQRISEKARIEG